MRKMFFFSFPVFLLLIFCAGAYATTALDPSVIGIGARALGMGRAYTAITGEPDSVFLNPAMLSDLPCWGATSMYSKLISQVDYITLGGAYPAAFGTVGFGFLGVSIGGLQNATIDPNTGRITYEAGTSSYYNNITSVSFGRSVMKDLNLGLNLKLFSQGYTSGNTGSGYDVDLGLSYRPLPNLTVGWLQRNLLPSSAGARIKWASGDEEGLATITRLGVNYNQGLSNLSADLEFSPTNPGPVLIKLGGEWWVIPALALRIGSDQDELETNLTAGLSYLFAGYKFDYAYHQYGALAANVTHTFSLTYGVFREKEEKVFLTLTRPEDKLITYNSSVSIEGLARPRVADLKLNNHTLALGKDGGFFAVEPLAEGKNSLNLLAFDPGGKLIDQKKLRILKLRPFIDVPPGYWVRDQISIMAMQNIVTGYPDGTFRPEGNITRAEICSLLMKTKGEKAPNLELSIFKDVPVKHWAANYIAQAVAQGTVKGYPDGKFKPNGPITRAEGVAMIARFSGLPEAAVLEAPFPDVPGRFWAVKEIIAAKEAGMLKYLEGKAFEPNKQLARAEVVEMLAKSKLLAPKVAEMLDFEGGY